MITLNVPEIHCEVCAGRIKNALGKKIGRASCRERV